MTVAHDIQARLMVGLEIHVELSTQSKMFTSAPNVANPQYFEAEPNTLCDPVVVGMPGTLPTLNKKAIEMSMLVGLALDCEIASFTKWDRKSYYYPDLPKNYQISQYDKPLCGEGKLEIPLSDDPDAPTKTVRIIRAHLEEDAGKLLHEAPGGYAIDHSIVDLNRAGTPLLEIVTYPDMDSADQVVAFAQTLRNICRTLGVTEGIMQKGHIRFEPNINVIIERGGKQYKTPIVEIKNLNSFKALYGAVQYEYERQIDTWLETGEVMTPGTKSTRGWDDQNNVTFLQREKEEAHDYRYFPDPDLVPVVVSEDWVQTIRERMPELPRQREARYLESGLSARDARTLVTEPKVATFFDAVVAQDVDAKRASVILLNNLARRANDRNCLISDLSITPQQVSAIEKMTQANQISSSGADELYKLCSEDGSLDPQQVAKDKGLLQVSDDASLQAWVDEAIAQNPKSVEAIKSGKMAAIGALVGAVMKLSRGKANPKVVQEKLRATLLG